MFNVSINRDCYFCISGLLQKFLFCWGKNVSNCRAVCLCTLVYSYFNITFPFLFCYIFCSCILKWKARKLQVPKSFVVRDNVFLPSKYTLSNWCFFADGQMLARKFSFFHRLPWGPNNCGLPKYRPPIKL